MLAHFCGHCSQAFHLLLLLGDWNYFYLESRLKTPAVLTENSPFEASLVYIVSSRPVRVIYAETLSQKAKQRKKPGQEFLLATDEDFYNLLPFLYEDMCAFSGKSISIHPREEGIEAVPSKSSLMSQCSWRGRGIWETLAWVTLMKTESPESPISSHLPPPVYCNIKYSWGRITCSWLRGGWGRRQWLESQVRVWFPLYQGMLTVLTYEGLVWAKPQLFWFPKGNCHVIPGGQSPTSRFLP